MAWHGQLKEPVGDNWNKDGSPDWDTLAFIHQLLFGSYSIEQCWWQYVMRRMGLAKQVNTIRLLHRENKRITSKRLLHRDDGRIREKVRTFSNWECIWQMIHGGIKLVKELPAGRPALCSSCSKAGHPWDRSTALLQLLYSAFPNFCFLRHFFFVFSCLPFLGKDKSPRATKPSEMDLTCS